MELFCGEEGSSLVSCTIYSLKEALNQKEFWNNTPILSDPEFTYHLPILCLQDIGDITMNLQAVSEGRDDYLCYPAPDTDRFTFLLMNGWSDILYARDMNFGFS